MALNNYMDDQLDLMCEGFFDNIDDLLDFSADEETNLGMADSNNALMSVPPTTEFPALDSKDCQVMPVAEENKICNDFGIGEDWFSKFLDDTNYDEEIKKNEPLFLSFSPDSVLEPSNFSADNAISSSSSSSSSSCSSHTTSLAPPFHPSKAQVPARARSKRPRRPVIPTPPPTTLQLPLPAPEPTIKKIKIKVRSASDPEDTTGVRKCRHCGIQKTPQWRAGPMGPKTLCNACGVRYKSGRLFPEYRPAASPTFVPSVHSNSHKKVVEIRNKDIENKVVEEYNPAAKNCDLLKYIRV